MHICCAPIHCLWHAVYLGKWQRGGCSENQNCKGPLGFIQIKVAKTRQHHPATAERKQGSFPKNPWDKQWNSEEARLTTFGRHAWPTIVMDCMCIWVLHQMVLQICFPHSSTRVPWGCPGNTNCSHSQIKFGHILLELLWPHRRQAMARIVCHCWNDYVTAHPQPFLSLGGDFLSQPPF